MKKIDTLVLIAVIAILFAAFNLIIQFDRIKELTGFATDTGTANLTIESLANVNFTTDNINWGSGYVNSTEDSATLNTEGVMNGTDWTTISSGLILENIGNVNVTVNLSAASVAADFIGGDTVTPEFKWKVSDSEANSCNLGPNITTYTEVTTSEQVACSNMGYQASVDTIEIDLMVLVPRNAVGTKGNVITAEATAVS